MSEDLARRLEAATEGSREMSDEAVRYMGWQPVDETYPEASGGWHSPEGRIYDWMPHITESVDDGLALTPDYMHWREIMEAAMFNMVRIHDEGPLPLKLLPLFISAALVRARTTG